MKKKMICVDLIETVVARNDNDFYSFIMQLFKDESISFDRIASKTRQRYLEYSFGNYHNDHEYIENVLLSVGEMLPSNEMIQKAVDHCLDHYWAIDGSHSFLEELKNRGYMIFIASNFITSWAEVLLDKFELNKHIDGIFISSDIHFRKPAPEFFQYIVDKSKFKPEESIFIGNSYANDYMGAKKFGMEAYHLKKNNVSGKGLVYSQILEKII